MKKPGKRDLPNTNQAAFLAAYCVSPNITEAARQAGVHRSMHYTWMEADPEYSRAFESAHAEAIDRLKAAVYKSATEGIEEPVIHQGQLCFEPLRNKDGSLKRYPKNHKDAGGIMFSSTPLTIRKRNDVAAFFLLKAEEPDKYRDNSTVEVKGSVDVIVQRLAAGRQRIAKRAEAS